MQNRNKKKFKIFNKTKIQLIEPNISTLND